MAAKSRPELARSFFTQMGYKPWQAAAVVGGLMQESAGLNPTPEPGDNGTAFGMAQWRGPRFQQLQTFAAEQGTDWTDFLTQLKFVDWELRNTEKGAGDKLFAATDVPSAAEAMISYERPQGWTPQTPREGHGWDARLKNAMGLMSGEKDDGRPMTGMTGGVAQRLSDIVRQSQQPPAAAAALAQQKFSDLFKVPEMRPLELPELPPIPTPPQVAYGPVELPSFEHRGSWSRLSKLPQGDRLTRSRRQTA